MDIKKALIEYFIKKFEVIPDGEIGQGDLMMHCPLWHCGLENYDNTTSEAIALLELCAKGDEWMYITEKGEKRFDWRYVYCAPDQGYSPHDDKIKIPGATPKERIINYLKTI